MARAVMTQGSRSAILLAALGAVLFSAKAVVVKLCYRHGADAETVLALRMLFSLPFFWAAVWWQTVTRRPAPMLRQDRLKVLLLGFVGYYLSSYLDFLGLQYISAGLERIILYLNPTIVLVASAIVLKKRIDSRQALAMAVAYAGVLLVFLHDVHGDGQRTTLGSALVSSRQYSSGRVRQCIVDVLLRPAGPDQQSTRNGEPGTEGVQPEPGERESLHLRANAPDHGRRETGGLGPGRAIRGGGPGRHSVPGLVLPG
jgi:uncharacterized membrane protein